jgi:histidyl-tRNA synthetase
MPEFKTVRGMRDFLPEEAGLMRFVEDRARWVARLYEYKEIITPVVEGYELLSAKAGEEVRSRMFVFKDLGGRDVALRPEFTASVARLVASVLRNEPKPLRLFCVGSIYRYDEPQRGRYREFWQSNYELMGSAKPEADAEVLLLTDSLIKGAGLQSCAFKIGHVGVLRGIFVQEGINDDVQSRAMQLMDKKQYDDAFKVVEDGGMSAKGLQALERLVELRGKDVEAVIEKMHNCVQNYSKAVSAVENLKEILDLASKSGANLDVTVEAGFARGLEYYTGMIVEVYVPDLNIALGGGGRYDRLIELFGGEPTPAVGIAHGIDRIMLGLQEQKTMLKTEGGKSVVVVPIAPTFLGDALRVAQLLRKKGVPVEVEVMRRKTSKTLEDADRKGIDFAVIVGEKELKEDAVAVRDLHKREQKTVKIENLVETVQQ